MGKEECKAGEGEMTEPVKVCYLPHLFSLVNYSLDECPLCKAEREIVDLKKEIEELKRG